MFVSCDGPPKGEGGKAGHKGGCDRLGLGLVEVNMTWADLWGDWVLEGVRLSLRLIGLGE